MTSSRRCTDIQNELYPKSPSITPRSTNSTSMHRRRGRHGPRHGPLASTQSDSVARLHTPGPGPVDFKRVYETDKKRGTGLVMFAIHHANITAAFISVAASTVLYGGYRTSSLCPFFDACRFVLHFVSPTLFHMHKHRLSSMCDEEDTLWRLFYDGWTKSAVTDTDSLSDLGASLVNLATMRTVAIQLIIIMTAIIIGFLQFVSGNLERTVMSCISPAGGDPKTGGCCCTHCSRFATPILFCVKTVSWLLWIVNLPVWMIHRILMRPIGSFVCSLPRHIGRCVPLPKRTPNPFYFLYCFGDESENGVSVAADDQEPVPTCSHEYLTTSFRKLACVMQQWFAAAISIITVFRIVCITTHVGPSFVWGVGWLTGDPDNFLAQQQRYYAMLTYSGAVEHHIISRLSSQWQVQQFSTATWIMLAVAIVISLSLQYSSSISDTVTVPVNMNSRSVELLEDAPLPTKRAVHDHTALR
jgi:hypothetical protein